LSILNNVQFKLTPVGCQEGRAWKTASRHLGNRKEKNFKDGFSLAGWNKRSLSLISFSSLEGTRAFEAIPPGL
jgi:hypothetical protein